MTQTYEQLPVDAFKYAMSTLLHLKDDSHLMKALSEEDLTKLEYKNSNGNILPVLRSDHNLSRILVAYNHMVKVEGQPIPIDQWTAINVKEYDAFHTHNYQTIKLGQLSSPAPPPPPPSTATTTASRHTPTDKFRRISGFNDLKEGDILEAYKIEEVARTL